METKSTFSGIVLPQIQNYSFYRVFLAMKQPWINKTGLAETWCPIAASPWGPNNNNQEDKLSSEMFFSASSDRLNSYRQLKMDSLSCSREAQLALESSRSLKGDGTSDLIPIDSRGKF